MLCIAKQEVERRTGPRGDDVKVFVCRFFDSRVADFDVQGKPVGNRFEESAFLGRGLIQDGPEFGPVAQQFGENKARKARAAAQIDQVFCRFGNERQELCGVPNVPSPDIFQGSGRNKIVPAAPIRQQTHKALEPRQCFT